MRRRQFIAGLGTAAAWPVVARAQQVAMPVVGWLGTNPRQMELFLPSFAQGLTETGYVVGRNVTIEPREGGIDRLPALAADLVRSCDGDCCDGSQFGAGRQSGYADHPGRFLHGQRPRRAWRGSQPQSSLGKSHRRYLRCYRVNRKAS